MPFKEEDINSNPYIKLYHDVLYDGEIQHIKTITTKNVSDYSWNKNYKINKLYLSTVIRILLQFSFRDYEV